MVSNKSVIVIGGGVAGLATASLLAKSGYEVTIIEKNSSLGGRARTLSANSFQFDMGPSWYLMPEVFEHFFNIFGKKTSEYYDLIRLNPRYQIVFGSDNQHVVLQDNLVQNKKLFDSIEAGAGEKLTKFLDDMHQAYDASVCQLVYEDIWSLSAWLNLKNYKALWILITKIRFWESWHGLVKKYFSSPKLQKILEFHAAFLGSSPNRTPALFSLLCWADFGLGVYYPKGGMGKFVDALESLAHENGVKIVTNEPVMSVNVSSKQIASVHTSKNQYSADYYVAACDIPYFETQLLPKSISKTDWSKKQLSFSAVLLYLGLDKKLPQPIHHTVYIAKDWNLNFAEIFDQKVLSSDPSMYISMRTASDKTIAPKNYEELFVLIPVPSKTNFSESQIAKFSDQAIRKLEDVFSSKISSHLVVKKIFSPQDFRLDYNTFGGSALGLAHSFTQSLWGRPANHHPQISNLFYTGQNANPGVGLPMALISSQIVAKKIHQSDSHTDQIFKQGSVTYYYSSLFFSGQTKKDVFNLYAYVRVIDDFVDSPNPNIKDFEHMWTQTKKCWESDHCSQQIVVEFVELAKRKNFSWDWIEAFWQAMRSDLKKHHYADFSELKKYMYGSAEVIGLMMAKILNLPEVSLSTAALQGQAMQYVNFIRDVKEDFDLGRNYLGYSDKEKSNPKLWARCVSHHIQSYLNIQSQASQGYKFIPKKYLVPIKTAADMYDWTARQILKNPSIVWTKKIKPSKLRVIFTAIKNIIIL